MKIRIKNSATQNTIKVFTFEGNSVTELCEVIEQETCGNVECPLVGTSRLLEMVNFYREAVALGASAKELATLAKEMTCFAVYGKDEIIYTFTVIEF